MAKKVTTAGAAAARRPAAAKPAALTPQQKANAKAVAALAKSLGVKAEVEGVEADEVSAETVATVLADGAGTLYTDGELAQGSEVFNDEALTEPTADGVYGTEDGRDVTIAEGVVTSIADTEAETEDTATGSTAAITAAVRAGLEPITARLDSLEAKFNSTTPPTPRPRAVAGQQQDPKGSAKPKPKAAHHSQL